MIGYFLARLHLCQIRQKIDSGFLTPSFGFLLVVDFLLCFVLLRQCIILRLYKQLQVQTLTKFSKTYSYCYNLVSFQCLSFTALLSANLPPTCYLRNEYTTFVYTRFITFVYPYEIGGVYECFLNILYYIFFLDNKSNHVRIQR